MYETHHRWNVKHDGIHTLIYAAIEDTQVYENLHQIDISILVYEVIKSLKLEDLWPKSTKETAKLLFTELK